MNGASLTEIGIMQSKPYKNTPSPGEWQGGLEVVDEGTVTA